MRGLESHVYLLDADGLPRGMRSDGVRREEDDRGCWGGLR